MKLEPRRPARRAADRPCRGRATTAGRPPRSEVAGHGLRADPVGAAVGDGPRGLPAWSGSGRRRPAPFGHRAADGAGRPMRTRRARDQGPAPRQLRRHPPSPRTRPAGGRPGRGGTRRPSRPGHLGHGPLAALGHEHRVVAETALAAGGGRDASGAHPRGDQQPPSGAMPTSTQTKAARRSAAPRAPRAGGGVVLVRGLGAGVAGAEHPRPAVQGPTSRPESSATTRPSRPAQSAAALIQAFWNEGGARLLGSNGWRARSRTSAAGGAPRARAPCRGLPVARTSLTRPRRRRRGLQLGGREPRGARTRPGPSCGRARRAVKVAPSAGGLDLDEVPGAGHDHVHVDLGARVLDVGQVEQRRAVDDADAHRRTCPAAGARAAPSLDQPARAWCSAT